MTEWTPGPWYLGDGVIKCADDEILMGPHRTAEETRANGRLIAGVLDLLKACESLLKLAEAQANLLACYRTGGKSPSEKTLSQIRKQWEIYEQAETAIAKAKGEGEHG